MRKIFRRSLFSLLLLALLVLATSLRAASNVSFTFTNFTKYQTISGGWTFPGNATQSSLSAGVIGITVTAIDSVPVTPTTIVAFCVELAELISRNIPYTFNYSPPTAAAAGYSAAIVRNAQILYDLFYLGDSIAAWTNQAAAAFQLALWELTHDTGGNLKAGDFRHNGGTNATVNLAQSYVNAVLATPPAYTPFTELSALTNVGSPGVQDLYIRASAIPFASNPGLGLAGVAALLFARWHERRRRSAAGGDIRAQGEAVIRGA